MGLLSDILEECRDQAIDYDPCLFPTGMLFYPVDQQKKIKDILAEYHAESDRHINNNALKAELLKRAETLESLKCTYLLSEKILLSLSRSKNFKSDLTVTKLLQLRNGLRRSYTAVCDTIHEIHQEIGEFEIRIEAPDCNALKDDLFKLLMLSFVYSLKNSDNAPFDTSSFRKLVSDMAGIICHFQSEVTTEQDKMLVANFLEKQLGLKKSHHKCRNCGNSLLNDLPYCLNCYERN